MTRVSHRWPDIVITVSLGTFCLAAYCATLTPSLSYSSPDGNELATVCYTLGLAHPSGYPLYTWLGKLFTYLPFGDIAHRVNLMSATLGAGGVSLLYLILRRLTDQSCPGASRAASAFGALLFGFSTTFWSQAVIAEVYTPNLFFTALALLTLIQWAHVHRSSDGTKGRLWFWAFALIYGLSLGTHLSSLGFAPAFALFVLLLDWRILLRPKVWLVGAGLFFAGALQFLWLPYKASTLNDQAILGVAPSTLTGIYSYTLGAFPQLRFAFPLAAVPERIVLYLTLLAQSFSTPGIIAGLFGMGALLFARPRHFFLLVAMYLIHVCFFVQYGAFDLDVFFIPAHCIYAVFIGFAAYSALSGIWSLANTRLRRRAFLASILTLPLVAGLTAGLVVEVVTNWDRSNRSSDTAINDFYENALALLPRGSVLLGRAGVVGYDMFYFRLVYDYRPDVTIPMLQGPRFTRELLVGREIYTTSLSTARGGGGPRDVSQELVPPDAWTVPVLLGQGASAAALGDQARPLILYKVQQRPPDLVRSTPQPHIPVDQKLGELVLLGYDLDPRLAMPGGRLHLTLYWRTTSPPHSLIATVLGDGLVLESHLLGMGNLQRYAQDVSELRGGAVVEDYWVVIPSSAQPGEYSLRLRLVPALPSWAVADQELSDPLVLQSVTLQDRDSH